MNHAIRVGLIDPSLSIASRMFKIIGDLISVAGLETVYV
jgi:hypothetical protein